MALKLMLQARLDSQSGESSRITLIRQTDSYSGLNNIQLPIRPSFQQGGNTPIQDQMR